MAFIAELPDSGLTDPMAGTAGIELFVDGKSQGHRSVDRLTNQSFLLDCAQAKELKVVVDCANENENGIIFILGSHKNPKRNKAFSRRELSVGQLMTNPLLRDTRNGVRQHGDCEDLGRLRFYTKR